jgi:hypothetical protein
MLAASHASDQIAAAEVGPAAAVRPTEPPLPPLPPADEDQWLEELMLMAQFLCVVLNCTASANSGASAELEMERWIATYSLRGVRTDLTPHERDHALEIIDDLIALSEHAPSRLDASLVARFGDMLGSAREDLVAGLDP